MDPFAMVLAALIVGVLGGSSGMGVIAVVLRYRAQNRGDNAKANATEKEAEVAERKQLADQAVQLQIAMAQQITELRGQITALQERQSRMVERDELRIEKDAKTLARIMILESERDHLNTIIAELRGLLEAAQVEAYRLAQQVVGLENQLIGNMASRQLVAGGT